MAATIARLKECAQAHLDFYTRRDGPRAFHTYDRLGDPDLLTPLDCLAPALLSININYRQVVPLFQSNGDIDINAGTVLEGKESVQEVGERIFEEVVQVASGKKYTKAEISGVHTEFKIWEQLWPAL